MEVWHDFQTGKYYSIDSETGMQSPSNRYGSEERKFKPYSSGFPHVLSVKPIPPDKMYTIQPKKFDGYCQFPRPTDSFGGKSPYARKLFKQNKVHIKEESKIPQPLDYLNMSQVSYRNTAKKKSNRATMSLERSFLNSISDIKQSLMEKPSLALKTVTDLSIKLETEKKYSKGYVRPKSKQKRRKLKGVFLKEFKTSGELFSVEKKIRELSNPTLVNKMKRLEKLDREMLEKKRLATKLMQIA